MKNLKLNDIVEYLVKDTNQIFKAKIYGFDIPQNKIYFTFDLHSKDPILNHNFTFEEITILTDTNTTLFKAYAKIEKDLNSTNITL